MNYAHYRLIIVNVLIMSLLGNLYYFVPAKAEESNGPHFNFVAAGDWGCGHEALNTFSMMKSMKPELYLGLGDYSYANTPECWLNIVNSVGPAFKIALGNHDTNDQLLRAYMDKFNLDNQYYSFDYQNSHFIALSTELNEDNQVKQLIFVKKDLVRAKENPNIDWIIVYFHRPFYTGNGVDNINMRNTYHPLFEEYDVDLVIQGHSHNYQRSFPLLYNDVRPSRPIITNNEQFHYDDPSGIIFVIVGTGGESIHGVDKKPYLASTYEGYGCINIEIDGKSMDAEYYSDSNNTIDHFVVIKGNNLEEFSPKLKAERTEFSNH
jgi:predicted phosphodiesterase